jgi:vitamin B12 transporter
VVYVGELYDQVAAIGRVEHGGYTVFDLTAGWFLDADRRHRLGFRLENALDEEYSTSVIRVRRDVTNVSYPVGNLGTERTLHVSYSVGF